MLLGDAVVDQELEDGVGTAGRELPVARELAAGDRDVVRVALDADRVLHLHRHDQLRHAVEERARGRLERRLAAVEDQVVRQQPDHEAALVDRRRDVIREAVLAGVLLDLALHLEQGVLLLGSGLRLRRRVRLRADQRVGEDIEAGVDRAARGGRLDALDAGRVALLDALAAVEHAADERLLQGVLEHLVLGDVHHRDREQHHEQRHQQRDHVGVGEEPALVADARAVPWRFLPRHQAAAPWPTLSSASAARPGSPRALVPRARPGRGTSGASPRRRAGCRPPGSR